MKIVSTFFLDISACWLLIDSIRPPASAKQPSVLTPFQPEHPRDIMPNRKQRRKKSKGSRTASSTSTGSTDISGVDPAETANPEEDNKLSSGNARVLEESPTTLFPENDITGSRKRKYMTTTSTSANATSAVDNNYEVQCPPPATREAPPSPPKIHDSEEATASTNDEPVTKKQRRILETAASRGLSKFARRLLDPNRPRGSNIVEPPQILPLNDEFLQAFGRRHQKEAMTDMGEQNDDNSVTSASNNDSTKIDTSEPVLDLDEKDTKIKISNLKYTITAETLYGVCSKFGPITHFHLVPDEEDDKLNAGRAYVVYTSLHSAQSCVENLKSLEGRPLSVTILAKKTQTPKTPSGPNSGALKRYWEKDITTKCYRCGGIGHISSNCPNDAMVKSCPLCASTDHDAPHRCPYKVFCFNCGVPGHMARDCQKPRGSVPVRRLCTICLGSKHEKFNCQSRQFLDQAAFIQSAICMTCGGTGHFMCKPMKWFFGLKGLFCYNCGESGHVGVFCRRPNLEACRENGELLLRELDRASAYNATDQRAAQAQEARGRGRDNRNEGQNNPSRSKSVPAPRPGHPGNRR